MSEKIENISPLCLLTWRYDNHSLARTTPISNIFSWSERCSSHWSSAVYVWSVDDLRLSIVLNVLQSYQNDWMGNGCVQWNPVCKWIDLSSIYFLTKTENREVGHTFALDSSCLGSMYLLQRKLMEFSYWFRRKMLFSGIFSWKTRQCVVIWEMLLSFLQLDEFLKLECDVANWFYQWGSLNPLRTLLLLWLPLNYQKIFVVLLSAKFHMFRLYRKVFCQRVCFIPLQAKMYSNAFFKQAYEW